MDVPPRQIPESLPSLQTRASQVYINRPALKMPLQHVLKAVGDLWPTDKQRVEKEIVDALNGHLLPAIEDALTVLPAQQERAVEKVLDAWSQIQARFSL